MRAVKYFFSKVLTGFSIYPADLLMIFLLLQNYNFRPRSNLAEKVKPDKKKM